ncbi:hypothetical protein TEQG_08781 [Trichophyton equinum CBS 127.97]|uniref:Uncharacterized protein n=1 Tax=Trichophyton equinum (strain ATCC MYA-4606 / CBS 127.97) TaxID=559882 RepID=F2Q2C7_TRIEC|nr:hypothetical protein TEQG_08781 [Trichophyton equinum CBS 127.97]
MLDSVLGMDCCLVCIHSVAFGLLHGESEKLFQPYNHVYYRTIFQENTPLVSGSWNRLDDFTHLALCGIPWAIACWAPFTLIGEEVNRLCVPVTSRDPTVTMITSATYSRRQDSSSSSPRDHAPSDIELDDGVLMLNHGHDGSDSEDQGGEVPDANISTGELAGIYLGILNVYTTLPQLFSMLVSWVIFRAFEPKLGAPRVTTHAASVKDQFVPNTMDVNTGSANASGLRLFIGALSALLAAESARRLKRTR